MADPRAASRPVLLVSGRPAIDREQAFREASGRGAGFELATDIRAALQRATPAAAIILDGQVEGLADALPDLRAFVERGGTLLAVGASPADLGSVAELLGGRALPPRETGELMVKRHRDAALLARLDDESPILDRFQPIEPGVGSVPLLVVNWALVEHAVAVERPVGDGWVVATTLGGTPAALRAPGLAALIRRTLIGSRGQSSDGTIRCAVVGYGPTSGMGFVHGTAIGRTAGLKLAAVCDASPDRRIAAATAFRGITIAASAEEIAADAGVDLVIIATPPATHAAIARQMLEAGKHVACEKPLCLTVAEADDLIDAAARRGLVLTVNQNRRWDSDFLAVRRAVRVGLLGDLFNVETFVGDFAHPCRYWHSDARVSGGAAFDWGSHFIDWTLLLHGGPPAWVAAVAHKRVWHDVTNADQVRIRMRWADGREAEFIASDLAAIRRPKFYLQGTAGTLEGRYRPLAFESIEPARGYVREEPHVAEAPAELRLVRYESGYGLTELRLPPQPRSDFGFHRNLADHLLLGDELAVTPESVRSVIAVLETADRSAAAGGTEIAVPGG